MRSSRLTVVWTFVFALGAVTPVTLHAQETRVDTAGIDEARLTLYAKAFAAIALVRDSISVELALPKNKKTEVQLELREKLRGQIAKVLGEHSLTQEEYARITYVVSTDGARRKMFEEILARLAPKSPPR